MTPEKSPIVLSFDVEEHDRIEAAAHLPFDPRQRQTYAARMEATTDQIVECLARANVQATFYIVGEIAETHPALVRRIAEAGHEIGSHSHVHHRIHRQTPEQFREDLRRSIGALEAACGQKVCGFRAPTFSVMKETAWAIDILAEEGLRYDSSIFPVRHDRYGVPDAPRTPFRVHGPSRELLELPPTTWHTLGQNVPVAGGGYFRLFPLALMRAGVNQLSRGAFPLAMLYFHPWEFDPEQPQLPLKKLSRWRTYVGIRQSFSRLEKLLRHYAGRFTRAIDVVERLHPQWEQLPQYPLAGESHSPQTR